MQFVCFRPNVKNKLINHCTLKNLFFSIPEIIEAESGQAVWIFNHYFSLETKKPVEHFLHVAIIGNGPSVSPNQLKLRLF